MIFSQIYVIIQKNIKRLMRSKISALIVIFGPLFMILLVGVAFNNSNLYGIKIGVYSPVKDNTTESIIEYIEKTDFKVIEERSQQSCIDDVSRGRTHLCIIFPESGEQKKIEFHVDYSKLNLVYTLLNILKTGLNEQSTQISLGITQDLLDRLQTTASDIRSNAESVRKFQSDVEALQIKLGEIRTTVDTLNMSFDFESIDMSGMQGDINQSRGEMGEVGDDVTDKIRVYQDELESLEDEITALKHDITDAQADIDSVQKNITGVHEELECTSEEYLFTVWDVETITSKLSATTDPQCALLYSMSQVIEDKSFTLENAISELEGLEREIAIAEKDLNQAETQIGNLVETTNGKFASAEEDIKTLSGTIDGARERIDMMNTRKNALSQDLVSIQDELDQGLGELDSFNSALDSVVDNLDSVTLSSAESIVKPVTTEIKPIVRNKNVLDYIFPSLVILIITFTSILLSSTIIMKEKSSPAYFRNFITPASNILFILGTYLTALAVVFMQCLIVFIVAAILFNIELLSNIHMITLAVLPITSIFILIGMIIGYAFNSEETTTLASISISCILFLFSSVIIPIENMSSGMASIAKMNPFVLSELVLRQLIIFQNSISAVSREMMFLLINIFTLFIIVIITRTISKYFIEQ